jgi:hypothetical protein
MVLAKDFAESPGNNHEIPHSGQPVSIYPAFILEDENDTLSRKVCNRLRPDATQNPRKMTSDKINFPYY